MKNITIIDKKHLRDIGLDELQIGLDENGVFWSRTVYEENGEFDAGPWYESDHYNVAAHKLLNPPNTGGFGCDDAAHATDNHYSDRGILGLQAAIRQGLLLLSDLNPTTK